MVTRIRTIDFLPEVFKTKTNEQFLSATLDQLVKQPNTEKVQGYIGSKFGYGVKTDDSYVVEKSKSRNDYQLEPAIVFKKTGTNEVIDLMTYEGMIDALRNEGGIVEDNNRLFSNQFYSWDSFTDLDKLINYGQYYWLPNGPESVGVTNASVYFNVTYDVTKGANSYDFAADTVPLKTSNPTLSLMRGGTYTFNVSQDSPFYIQGAPGINGTDPARPNINTRDILGLSKNGVSNGTFTFTVPFANEQDNMNFPGNTEVDLVTRLSFDQIHGKPVRELKSIDGISSLDGKTLLFFGAKQDDRGYLGDLFASTPFGVDNPNANLTDVFEDGQYTNIADNIYQITYQGTGLDAVISLVEYHQVPNNQKITAVYGEEFIARTFIKPSFGDLYMIPFLSARLDTLYYQDGSSEGVFGKIRILEQLSDYTIDVQNDIIGQKTYTSPNGVRFTNGLKVNFSGFIYPETYKTGNYYVEGVGESINLIPVDELVVPEPFTENFSSPFEVKAFDLESFGSSLSVPTSKDFITINRNSNDRNAWSRSNRWFHYDVLAQTIERNPNSPIAQAALSGTTARANRPIIEFYANLRLFNHGTEYKAPVDYIDFTSTDALNTIPGNTQILIDGQLSDISDGARIILAADNNVEVRSKIFVVTNTRITETGPSTIVLSPATDGAVNVDQQIIITTGANQGKSFYFDGTSWIMSQQKTLVNQPPKFDIFDSNGISFSAQEYYPGSDFSGCTLFEFATGVGADDPVLGIPLAYSSVENIGDIQFNISLNSESFSFTDGITSRTFPVSYGYVYKYSDRTTYARQIGWQTAAGPSFQYQVFNYTGTDLLSPNFQCDITPKDQADSAWPVLVVYLNNTRLLPSEYTVTSLSGKTTVSILSFTAADSVQIMVYSDQVSKIGYYQIPENFDSNPFNYPVTTVHLGDVRGHFKSICNNTLDLVGDSFGANNYRDLGNIVPYGTKIIQNSGSMGTPAIYLRNKEYNIFDALSYNANEYIKFKALLVNTVTNGDYNTYQQVDEILDDVLNSIAAIRSESNPFYWSDMVPSKSPVVNKTYPIGNVINKVDYPLSRIYSFTKANYYSVLVYVTTTIEGVKTKNQLVRDVDYVVSETEPKVTLTYKLSAGDVVNIKEYDQTFGSFVPNTPTKNGLYPKTEPEVETYTTYLTPTSFIVGHDNSYTKTFGEVVNGELTDLRDKVLFEYEKRVYNNLKVIAKIPLLREDIFPGQFRKTEFSYEEVQQLYATQFLNWAGQNRIDYKSQFYSMTEDFTWNYNQARNKLDNTELKQGNWRGIYIWLYDTHSPDSSPWEMLGYSSKPSWWVNRYGSAPYTSENDLLWGDLERGFDYNDGDSFINPKFARPGLSQILPVDTLGKLLPPSMSTVGYSEAANYNRSWKVGDVGPAEFSYLKSSTWPFDLMRIFALTKPPVFFTQGLDLDSYRYNEEFNQFLVFDRFRAAPSDLVVYGGGTGKTRAEIEGYASHSINSWVVDYLRQFGISGSNDIANMIKELQVNLVYRVSGFTDKDMMKFYMEKGSPNSKNSSLLIPEESYSILLYENQPFDKITYSSVIVQKTENGYTVSGNSQDRAFFQTLVPKSNGSFEEIVVNSVSIKIPKDASSDVAIVPYGTEFSSYQGVCTFLANYGRFLESRGMVFDTLENNIQVTWRQMVNELLYWLTSGWEVGSIVSINPAANELVVNRTESVVQSLTLSKQNYALDQNLIPIQLKDLGVYRNGTEFRLTALSDKQTISYFSAGLSNVEHVVVFDNTTIFNDTVFNVVTGLRQQRLFVRGIKTADWDGTFDTQGFILNQDNIEDWQENQKYTKGVIVFHKNNYWVANTMIQPNVDFTKQDWIKTDYELISKGMLPNASTRAFESTLYYDAARSNLNSDADLLSFSLVGYRPRDYLSQANITDISQFNIFKDIIKSKGTFNSINILNGAELPQGTVNYQVYENWAIKSAEYGGLVNQNFVEFGLNKQLLTGNPSIVGLTSGYEVPGVQQYVTLNNITNYAKSTSSENILSTLADHSKETEILRSAGYVNFDDVDFTAFNLSELSSATASAIYKNDYLWVANHKNDWDVFSPTSIINNNQPVHLINVANNLDGTATFTFDNQHNLTTDSLLVIMNFNSTVNGFYTIAAVTGLSSVVVSLSLDGSVTTLAGFGMAIQLQSHRLLTPSDVKYLPLLDNEFVKNKAWIDYGTDGNWAVYSKTNNYSPVDASVIGSTETFGNSVAYHPKLGYFFADGGSRKVYRAAYDETLGTFSTLETLQPLFNRVSPLTFGKKIVVQGDMLIISQPDNFGTDSFLWIYKLVNTDKVKRAVYQQYIWVSGGGIGEHMVMSGDTNYLYASASSYSGAVVFQKNVLPFLDTTGILLSVAAPVGATSFVVPGNRVADLPVGEDITFANDDKAPTYMLVTSRFNSASNITTFYIDNPLTEEISVGAQVYTSSINYSFVGAFTAGNDPTDGFSLAMTTTHNGDMVFIGAPSYDFSEFQTNTGMGYVFERLSETFEIKTDSPPLTNTVLVVPWVTSAGTVLSINGVRYDTVLAGTRAAPVWVYPDSLVEGATVLLVGPDLFAGDRVTVDSVNMVEKQVISAYDTSNQVVSGAMFGHGMDCNISGADLVVGAPYFIDEKGVEGHVYRFINEGKKYGVINGLLPVTLAEPVDILINHFRISIPAGNAKAVADAINVNALDNIVAEATDDTNEGKLVIRLRDPSLGPVNNKLTLTVFNGSILYYLGISEYTKTQVISSPHAEKGSQFGYNVAFNEYNSFVVSAPTGTRFLGTTFDFTDDENNHNDTAFDNNFTQFVDFADHAGEVYMYDYMPGYNESLLNSGNYVYAQALTDSVADTGIKPMYGKALFFRHNKVIVGTPDYKPAEVGGKATVFNNSSNTSNWKVDRISAPVVDVNKIQKVQIFDSALNSMIAPLDYIDPIQGKLLGAVRENIDFVSFTDPAGYNSTAGTGNIAWGKMNVGSIWFDPSSTRFVNYHQGDTSYNSKYWGKVFPGSTVTVYTWIESDTTPAFYVGAGSPYDVESYSASYDVDSTGNLITKYYFWVRNTNVVYSLAGKTLSDSVIESYIRDPQATGIPYFAAFSSSTFGLYNVTDQLTFDSSLYIGFSNTVADNPSHSSYQLIRDGAPDDFLSGFPTALNNYSDPTGLYLKLLDSFAGLDTAGSLVPNPNLPAMLKIGISNKPNQSMFVDRLKALRNYLVYVNQVLKLYPVYEFKEASFLNNAGATFDTTKYWNYVNWWATGYNDNTKSLVDVGRYYELQTLDTFEGMIVGVQSNSNGRRETYIRTNNEWVRIGLENGTIEFSSALWNYSTNSIGLGSSFFDTDSYDTYPSAETRSVIRAINEQIFVGELFKFRNEGLILMFEYIQSENIESHNNMPWLTKTSFIDVGNTVRELITYPKFQKDDDELLYGYIQEAKPYHAVVKDFFMRYTGLETYNSGVTDFDLPAIYNQSLYKFTSPELVYSTTSTNQYNPGDAIWGTQEYSNWYSNLGLQLRGDNNAEVALVAKYMTVTDNVIFVDNAYGLPVQGLVKIDDELIAYSRVNRVLGRLEGLSRGSSGTTITEHFPTSRVYMTLPGVVVVDTGRGYIDPPAVRAIIDTTKYPAPTRAAALTAIMSGDKVIGVTVNDSGEGYVAVPTIYIEPSISIQFNTTAINFADNTIVVQTNKFVTGDLIRYVDLNFGVVNELKVTGLTHNTFYYVNIISALGDNASLITLHRAYAQAQSGDNPIELYTKNQLGSSIITTFDDAPEYALEIAAKAASVTKNTRVRELTTKIRYDRTSYGSTVQNWEPGMFWPSPFNSLGNDASSTTKIYDAQADITQASWQGAMLDITGVSNDQGTVVATVDYSHSNGLQPGQIKGLKMYFYKTFPGYQYDDTANGGAKFKIYRPRFDPTGIVNAYYIVLENSGTIYSDGDVIKVDGSELGGRDGLNDFILTIQYVTVQNGISIYAIEGIAVGEFKMYYANPVAQTQIKIYTDPSFRIPVLYDSFTFGAGDYVFLPEPFSTSAGYKYVVAATVTYNNKVYRCVESNSDMTFDYNKWAEVKPDDRSLNAIDRVLSYYKPTSTMPNNLLQVVQGLTYPYNVYRGNAFAEDEALPLDIVLKDTPFYPRDVNITSITYDGINYIATADASSHSLVLVSTDGEIWNTYKISNKVLNLTGIATTESPSYIITSNTNTAPVMISFDIQNWETLGAYTPYDVIIFGESGFDSSGIQAPKGSMNGIAQLYGEFFAVGSNVIKSSNGLSWEAAFDFGSSLPNTLTSIVAVESMFFAGLIAVGYGLKVISGAGSAAPVIEQVGRVITSTDGITWKVIDPAFTGEELHTVAASDTVIVAAGTNGKVFYSNNGEIWYPANVNGQVLTHTIRSSIYADSTFVMVGDNGTVITSSDGIEWYQHSSTTTSDLNGITFDGEYFVAVGDYGVIIRSRNQGETWLDVSFITTKTPSYSIQGDDFVSGYGPEELVAGVVTDTLNIKVVTKPGAFWDNDAITQSFKYGHTGFDMKSKTLVPDFTNTFSFDGMLDNPVQVAVFVEDKVSGLSTRLYETYGYTVNWVTKVITLTDPIDSTKTILVEVYDFGNGREIVRANSQNTPLIVEEVSGHSQFLLLNYTFVQSFNLRNLTTVDIDPVIYHNGVKLANDKFEVAIVQNGTLISFTDTYDLETDYLTFILMSSTVVPEFNELLYGYSLPETQVFEYVDSSAFEVANYIGNVKELNYAVVEDFNDGHTYATMGYDNPGFSAFNVGDKVTITGMLPTSWNTVNATITHISTANGGATRTFSYIIGSTYSTATEFGTAHNGYTAATSSVVEVNGERLASTDYEIDVFTATLTVSAALSSGDLVAITTFNDFQRQNLVTTEVTTLRVAPIYYIDNTTTPILVTTSEDHGLVDGDNIRLDGIKGSVQLNNATYYAKVLSSYTSNGKTYYPVELYESVSTFGGNLVFALPVSGSTVEAYDVSGYLWKNTSTVTVTSGSTYTEGSRTWVTVNGKRVDPSNLRFNSNNKLSIMAPIVPTDSVIITAMVSEATPGSMTYNVSVDKLGNGKIHRLTNDVWLTQPLFAYEDVIHVNNARLLVNNIVENLTAITESDSVVAKLNYKIEDMSGVVVYNASTLLTLSKDDYVVKNVNSRPTVIFTAGVSEGDNLQVTIQIGHVVTINGEQIRFRAVDFTTNTVSGLIRGIHGTGIKKTHNVHSFVHGMNDATMLDPIFYDNVLNSSNYTSRGDPMQISDSPAAKFLQTGHY